MFMITKNMLFWEISPGNMLIILYQLTKFKIASYT